MPADALFQVGSITVTHADLTYLLEEHDEGRTDATAVAHATDVLQRRAQAVQAARDAGLDEDPLVRHEVARLLENRLREVALGPRIRASLDVSDERLQELYRDAGERFVQPERRQVAVLWLDPGADPARVARDTARLEEARAWLLANPELRDDPAQGFAALSVDHSAHAPTRFTGGIVGWMERAGGLDAWHKAVADIAFTIAEPGSMSAVVVRPEGVFVVRWMDQRPAVQLALDTVAPQLIQEERARRRRELEANFARDIEVAHPVRLPPAPHTP